MNKKGFVLMETIVVILIVSVSLLTLFSSFNKILTKMKTQNRYDTPEYIYMVNYIKERMQRDTRSGENKLYDLNGAGAKVYQIFDFADPSSTVHDYLSSYGANYYFSYNEQKMLKQIYNVKNIYIVKGISSGNMDENLKKFPPYVTEYFKKIDATERDEIIVVVFNRTVLDENGHIKNIYCANQTSGGMYCNDNTAGTNDDNLTHTYIASLKW